MLIGLCQLEALAWDLEGGSHCLMVWGCFRLAVRVVTAQAAASGFTGDRRQLRCRGRTHGATSHLCRAAETNSLEGGDCSVVQGAVAAVGS